MLVGAVLASVPHALGEAVDVAIGFGRSTLARSDQGGVFDQPSTLQFGPDGRLYVGLLNGTIKVYDVLRRGSNDYVATQLDEITAIKDITNHDDDGTPNTTCPAICKRLMTGILVTGTPGNVVIYATSSDPRTGGGTGIDPGLDTNSGTISRLTETTGGWQHTILVRGLPRSEHNHATNGLALDPADNVLYVAQGGNTNKGAPSFKMEYLPEYALSAAILAVDLDAITSPPYDLPTLDDEDRLGNPDAHDPFGGNDGKNQAVLVPDGPVQVYASGFRNPYDLVRTRAGRIYAVDNGANADWGNVPVGEGPSGTCTNEANEPGTSEPDRLHLVTEGSYHGHPNPTRGNNANTFNVSNPQSPVPVDDPGQCGFLGDGGLGLTQLGRSTNGIDEYSSDNFGGAMDGDLIAASFTAVTVSRVKLDAQGDDVLLNETLFAGVGSRPLDVDVLGPSDPFPGTIWVTDYSGDTIYVFEPNDYGGGSPCSGADDQGLDEDEDGYTNADEIDNATDPCSAASVPPDADGDGISDLNDPDDDDDGRPDTSDPFALDPDDGTSTPLPVELEWNDPIPGTLLDTGFTGAMTDGTTDYAASIDPSHVTIGVGGLTIDAVPAGDAWKQKNSQRFGFQLGVSPGAGVFTVQARVTAPFDGLAPQASQAMGLAIGDGDQSDYAKIVIRGNKGGQIQFAKEIGDAIATSRKKLVPLPGPEYVDLFLTIDASAGTVRGAYQVTDGATGSLTHLGNAVSIPARWFDGSQALAIGLLATSVGPGPEFPATWDFLRAASAA